MTIWAPGKTLLEIKRQAIVEALEHHNWNRNRTARALGVGERTMRYWVRKYDLPKGSPGQIPNETKRV